MALQLIGLFVVFVLIVLGLISLINFFRLAKKSGVKNGRS